MSIELRQRILHACCVRPTGTKTFTEGSAMLVHPGIQVEAHFKQLVADGLIEQRGLVYVATEAGVAEHTRPKSYATTRTHTNSSQPNWTPPKWVIARRGAEDHKLCGRVGIDA